MFRKGLKAKQHPNLELCLLGCLPRWTQSHLLLILGPHKYPLRPPPACCCGSCRSQVDISSPVPSLGIPGICLCLWEACWAQEACEAVSGASKHSVTLWGFNASLKLQQTLPKKWASPFSPRTLVSPHAHPLHAYLNQQRSFLASRSRLHFIFIL